MKNLNFKLNLKKTKPLEALGLKILIGLIVLYTLLNVISASLDNNLVYYFKLDNYDYPSNLTYDFYNRVNMSLILFNSSSPLIPGIIDNAFNFSGTDARRLQNNTPNNYLPSGNINLTLSLWVKWKGLDAGNALIFWYGGRTISGDAFTLSYYVPNGELRFATDAGNDVMGKFTPIMNNWYHIAISSYNLNKGKIYVNGVKLNDSNFSLNDNINIPSGSSFSIGNCVDSNCGTHDFFKGFIDEVKIFNKTINDSEALELFYDLNYFKINSINYTTPVTSGTLENFNINITYNSTSFSLTNAYLIYNGTPYLSNISGSGYIYNNLTIPSITQPNEQKDFYYSIGLVNSTGTFYFNTSVFYQSVTNLGNLNSGSTCGAGFSPAINFSFYDEKNRTLFNVTNIRYVFYYGQSGNSSLFILNNSLTNSNYFYLCINNTFSYYDLGYGEIDYYNSDTASRRYYIFSGTRITSSMISLGLYNLASSSSTTLEVTAQTTGINPYQNYYVALLRWYPEINSYLVVDMGKTDNDGKTILNVEKETANYKLALYSPTGVLIKLTDSLRFTCSTTPCTYNLLVNFNELDLTEFTDIQYSLTYDTSTKKFIFTFNDPSQNTKTMNLSVYKQTPLNETIICSSVSTTYVGTLVCDVSLYTGRLTAKVTRQSSPIVEIAQKVIEIRNTFISSGGGFIGLLIGAILLIFMALIGTISPILVVILGLLSLIPLYFLGNISWIVLTSLGVIGGIILHFLRRVM